MFDWMQAAALLAEDAAKGNENPTTPFWQMVPAMVIIAVIWYFVLLRPQRREQSKRDALMKELKKNDRVVTIGGIIGTVANVADNGKEVTLKVDDNTKLRFLRSAIQTVLKEESEGDAAKT